jgi:hypothetical protein
MRAIASGPQSEQRFYVNQRSGGPYLDLMLSNVESGPTPLLLSGFTAYYRSYRIGGGEPELPVPTELKALYKSVLAWLRDRGRCAVTQNAGRRYWIGRRAEQMLLDGARTNVEGLRLANKPERRRGT